MRSVRESGGSANSGDTRSRSRGTRRRATGSATMTVSLVLSACSMTRRAVALSSAPNGTAPIAPKPSANRSKCSGSPANSPDTAVTLSPGGGCTTTRTNDPWRGKRGHQTTCRATAVPCPVTPPGTRYRASATMYRKGVGMGQATPPRPVCAGTDASGPTAHPGRSRAPLACRRPAASVRDTRDSRSAPPRHRPPAPPRAPIRTSCAAAPAPGAVSLRRPCRRTRIGRPRAAGRPRAHVRAIARRGLPDASPSLPVGRGCRLPQRAGSIAGRQQYPRRHGLLLVTDNAGPVVARLSREGRCDRRERRDLDACLGGVATPRGAEPAGEVPQGFPDAALPRRAHGKPSRCRPIAAFQRHTRFHRHAIVVRDQRVAREHRGEREALRDGPPRRRVAPLLEVPVHHVVERVELLRRHALEVLRARVLDARIERPLVGGDRFVPQAEANENVRRHVLRVWRRGRDLRVATGGIEPERGELG